MPHASASFRGAIGPVLECLLFSCRQTRTKCLADNRQTRLAVLQIRKSSRLCPLILSVSEALSASYSSVRFIALALPSCGAIDRRVSRPGMERTEQCARCMERYCWHGDSVPEFYLGPPGGMYEKGGYLDLEMVLKPGITWAEWNKTAPP
jgi:hypothetical protein